MPEKKFIGFFVPKSVHQKIKAAAKREQRSISSYIRIKVLGGVTHPKPENTKCI